MGVSCKETDSRVVPVKWPGTEPQRSQWAGTKWEAGEDARQEAGVDGGRPIL